MSERQLTAYDVADHYDDAYFADLAQRYRARNRFARRRIANVFTLTPTSLARQTLLDIGCGMGTFTIEAAQRGAFAIGVDPAPAAVRSARAVALAEGAANARFVRADAVALPLGSASVDVVLTADVTEHLDDGTLHSVLREAERVMRPGARLIVYTPERDHIFERLRARGVLKQDPSHIRVRQRAELVRAVEQAGLRVETRRWLPSHVPLLELLERHLADAVPLLRRRIGIVARKGST